jgi:hypothetical protein
MEIQNQSRNRNILADVFFLLLVIGLTVSLVLPSVSETAKVLLLGGGLLVAGVWGRRKLGQG